MAACFLEAVAALRRQGHAHAANLTEIAGAASGLLSTGRFDELDHLGSELVDRYRTHGPPSLLLLTLTMLGFSARFRGLPDRAAEFFDAAANVVAPAGTFSVNAAIEARTAFRRGQRARAFQLLRDHVDEILEGDNVDVARIACIEFVDMMTTIGRRSDAARVLDYLETTGRFGALATTTLAAGAAEKIREGVGGDPKEPLGGNDPDVRRTLEFIREVLNRLL